MRVLLADDNPEMRRATRALLESQGHRVLAASEGREALAVADHREIDLLITDLSMPGMDGIELADRLSGQAFDRGHPVAVLLQSSDSDHPGLRRRVLDGGMAFVRKPYSSAELEEEIDTAFARKETLSRLLAAGASSPEDRAAPSVEEPLPAARDDVPAVIPAAARPAAKPEWLPPLWQLAAGAVLVLAAGGALRTLLPEPPPLSAPPTTAVRRGMEVEIVEPRGRVSALPGAFEWRRVEDGHHYRVTVRAVDERILWSGSVDGTRLEPPPELAAELRPAVSYTWSVEALDPEGNLLARSARIQFRIAPSAAAGGGSP